MDIYLLVRAASGTPLARILADSAARKEGDDSTVGSYNSFSAGIFLFNSSS